LLAHKVPGWVVSAAAKVTAVPIYLGLLLLVGLKLATR
jgi:hypothetical protein